MLLNNLKSLIMDFLPDDRPITSLQIVEYHDKCPKNFISIHKTYDLDSDADLWRETNMFGKKTGRGRYLCISKTEGLPEYVIETLKIIGDRDSQPEGFSILLKTADTGQRAWRRKQIIYKLAKRQAIRLAVTGIIICANAKNPMPEGFTCAGDINGITVGFKLGVISKSEISMIQNVPDYENDITNKIQDLKTSKPFCPLPKKHAGHDYEIIIPNYQIKNIKSPIRPAPRPPTASCGTIGMYSDLAGIPFVINPDYKRISNYMMPDLNKFVKFETMYYDFYLERQVLCTIKTHANELNNPFFK